MTPTLPQYAANCIGYIIDNYTGYLPEPVKHVIETIKTQIALGAVDKNDLQNQYLFFSEAAQFGLPPDFFALQAVYANYVFAPVNTALPASLSFNAGETVLNIPAGQGPFAAFAKFDDPLTDGSITLTNATLNLTEAVFVFIGIED